MPRKPFSELKRIAVAGVALATLALVSSVGGGAKPALAMTNCTVSDNTFDAQEKEFLRLINQYRAQNGKGPLTVSTSLNRAASWMARDMAVNNYFSHADSLGRYPNTRIANCDGKPSFGENIAAGTYKDTAAEAFEMWKNSAGHNANMLNDSYKQIGIARYYDAGSRYKWYWASEFSTANDGTNASGGSSSNGSTAAPSPTPSPTSPAPSTSATAVMTSPAPGSTLATTTKFTWAPGSDSSRYIVYMGTSKGASNIFNYNGGGVTSLTVRSIPKTGKTVYVRLWSLTSEGWKYVDYTYSFPR